MDAVLQRGGVFAAVERQGKHGDRAAAAVFLVRVAVDAGEFKVAIQHDRFDRLDVAGRLDRKANGVRRRAQLTRVARHRGVQDVGGVRAGARENRAAEEGQSGDSAVHRVGVTGGVPQPPPC